MRIRPCRPGDLKTLKAAFPALKSKPTVRGAAALWEDDGNPLAFAWAEPRKGLKRDWEVRFLGAVEDRKGLGLESQVLITLELEIEKKAGNSLSIWTPAEHPDSGGDFIRDLVKPRGYRFREYDSGHFAKQIPGDRYEKDLFPDELPRGPASLPGDEGDDERGDPGLPFPLLSLN